MCRFSVKNKRRLFWINICFRPIKLTSVSVALWRLDTCIVFFANVYAFSVLALCFLSEITLFAIFDNEISLVSHATKYQTNVHCFRLSKHQTTLPPQATIKQARFYKPCAYDKQLGFNKPAVVIADSLFVDSGICVLTVVCAICDIRARSGFGTNTPQIAGARP